MSYQVSDDEEKKGLSSRSSSSSSNSSSSSTSSSSPQSRHRRYSKSRSSSSRSRTRSRSRSPKRSSKPRRRDEHKHRYYGKEEDPANDSQHNVLDKKNKSYLQDYRRADEDSSDDDSVDDSIRSGDKSNKSSGTAPSNGGTTTTTSRFAQPSDAVTSFDENVPKAPPPPRISKIPIQFGKPGTIARPGIHMKLAPPKPKSEAPKKITVASAFNNDSDDEVEDMPPECKMRMRNIGRDTPTSSGPNSFGKTKQGFIDSKKLFEKSLREAVMD